MELKVGPSSLLLKALLPLSVLLDAVLPILLAFHVHTIFLRVDLFPQYFSKLSLLIYLCSLARRHFRPLRLFNEVFAVGYC